MASVSNVLFPILFADDTNVFLSGNNIDELIRIMNNELTKIVVWLDCNKLSFNISKTHYILFRSQGMRKPLIGENLEIRGEHIQRDCKTKFLGVIVDEKLTWADHIQYIRTKIAKGLGIICKAKKTPELPNTAYAVLLLRLSLFWIIVLKFGVTAAKSIRKR